jgi:hypothetical protein
MKERVINPAFYIEKGYEVTKLLRSPTSHPRIIGDTAKTDIGYVFTADQQRDQIRSTLLLCLDLDEPCALVISSNMKNALDNPDEKLMAFLRYVGEQIRADLLEGDFLQKIGEIRPDLFPKGGVALIPKGGRDTSVVPPLIGSTYADVSTKADNTSSS